MLSSRLHPRWFPLAAAVLFVVLFAELFFSVRQNSQTFDESAHIYAGYSYWKHGDFGINPEHPPVAKMVATLPLLPLHLEAQPAPPIYFRAASAVAGRVFLDPGYPCKRLPSFFSMVFGVPQEPVPAQIHGPIFLGSQAISGFGWGPSEINPYDPFVRSHPDDEIQGEILVYNVMAPPKNPAASLTSGL